MSRLTTRLILMAALIAWFAPQVLAQPTTAPVDAAAVPQQNAFVVLSRLIIGRPDFVTAIIGLCSIAAVTFMILGFLKTRRDAVMPAASTAKLREFIEGRHYQAAIDFAEADPSFVSKVIGPAIKRAPNYGSMKEAMEVAIGEQTADAFRRIEPLNIIGNLGTLLGLLGTVFGMIKAFDQMSRAGGSANPQVLSDGIATALAHTFLGLALAIPCLAAFSFLRLRTDSLTTRAALVAEELLLSMRPNAESRPASPTRSTVHSS